MTRATARLKAKFREEQPPAWKRNFIETIPIVGYKFFNEFLARIDQRRENRRHIDIQVVQPNQIVQAVH